MSNLSGASLGVIEKLETHPNADSLDIATVNGCPTIVRRGEFTNGEAIVFVPFDSIIPNSEEFEEVFRGKRVKPMKLRGVFSMAITLKNKWGFTEADDINSKLGITKYEPPEEFEGCSNTCGPSQSDGQEGTSPSVPTSKYDLDSLRKYHRYFMDGEAVVITEKIHGCNSRFVYESDSDTLFVGSRTRWLKPSGDPRSHWWRIAEKYNLANKLKDWPGQVLYGEIFGNVGGFPYGVPKGDVEFAAFDMYNPLRGEFLDYDDASAICDYIEVPNVPLLYRGTWNGLENHKELAEGPSTLDKHVREGFVVKPVQERRVGNNHSDRVALKLHGEGFLLKQGKNK